MTYTSSGSVEATVEHCFVMLKIVETIEKPLLLLLQALTHKQTSKPPKRPAPREVLRPRRKAAKQETHKLTKQQT